MRILLTQNQVASTNVVRTALIHAGMNVDVAASGGEVIEYAQTYEYDLVILELKLRDIDGVAILRKLRANQNTVPVLVLSGNTAADVRVRALTAGADDCLASPYDTAELIGRVQAIVRRSRGFCQPALTAGNVTLDLGSREVCVDGAVVHLTGKEFATLELMMLRQGAVQSKEAFLDHLYGGMDEPNAKIIDVFICKLRKKLAEAGADRLITTVWGHGYMLRAATEQPAAKAPAASPARKPVAARAQFDHAA